MLDFKIKAVNVPTTQTLAGTMKLMLLCFDSTVNLEIFARILFSRNFAYVKFRENKTLVKSHSRLLI